jgi:putative endonuclease
MPLFDLALPWRRSDAKLLGRRGEARAARFYQLRFFRVLARNFRSGRGEVDLIARRGNLVVFVEVKTRQQSVAGAPYEAVDREKQLQIAKIAERYLLANRLEGCRVRFDVLSLYWTGWRFRIEHFPGAFELASEPGRPWLNR